MSQHVDRALLLYQQSRYELAEQEARQALVESNQNAMAHAVLALVLIERQSFDEAEQEAKASIVCEPDFAFSHYTLAQVFRARNRFDESLAAAQYAVKLNPMFDDGFSLVAALQFHKKRWHEALQASDEGLAINPENATCLNLRAMSLLKLGRRAEAQTTIDGTLEKTPDNAFSHANQGWAFLESGKHREALNHFREALRLEPDLEWARQGILESMRSRNFVYRWLLKFFLLMARMSDKAQWAIIFGMLFGVRIVRAIGRNYPHLQGFTTAIIVLYFVFCILTWIARPLFNLVLRLDPFGRLVLSKEETLASNLIGALLLLAIVCAVLAFVTGQSILILAAACLVMLTLPSAGIFNCEQGWPRTSMMLATAGIAVVGIAALVTLQLEMRQSDVLVPAFVIGMFLISLGGNAAARAMPKR